MGRSVTEFVRQELSRVAWRVIARVSGGAESYRGERGPRCRGRSGSAGVFEEHPGFLPPHSLEASGVRGRTKAGAFSSIQTVHRSAKAVTFRTPDPQKP